MLALLNKEVRLLFVTVAVVLLAFIVVGQLLAGYLADDFKQTMVAHDSELAGYLHRYGLDETRIAQAFAADKTRDDAQAGQSLLAAAGYGDDTPTSLLPLAAALHQKYAVVLLVLSVLLSLAILAVLLRFARQQEARVERATADILRFAQGDTLVRLDDRGEGSLPRLFASVNSLATSLTSYVEKEKRGQALLRDAISDVSHQLKTPLAALQMYNDIIQNEQIGHPVVDDFIAKSQRELERIETLVHNLLKLTRLDAGLIELQKSPHNLSAFLEDCARGFRTRADVEGKTLSVDCPGHLSLSFDDDWLLEAIANLIKNALDHTSAGGRISLQGRETPVFVEITVTDDGAGIHPDDIHHIFKRFYRSRFSKDRQGIGIGLSLSKAIVEHHGGSIVVESEPGKETAFHVVFPKLSNM